VGPTPMMRSPDVPGKPNRGATPLEVDRYSILRSSLTFAITWGAWIGLVMYAFALS
jgi:hypothetical protein